MKIIKILIKNPIYAPDSMILFNTDAKIWCLNLDHLF